MQQKGTSKFNTLYNNNTNHYQSRANNITAQNAGENNTVGGSGMQVGGLNRFVNQS
jgi:hypothetical protein